MLGLEKFDISAVDGKGKFVSERRGAISWNIDE